LDFFMRARSACRGANGDAGALSAPVIVGGVFELELREADVDLPAERSYKAQGYAYASRFSVLYKRKSVRRFVSLRSSCKVGSRWVCPMTRSL
jgi:hypothetical protein